MLAILNNYLFFSFLLTLAMSNNLVLFFISWVGLNISLYGIILKGFNSYNKEVTLKYFISGSIITIFILFGILLYFMDYFTFSITDSNYLFFNKTSLIQTNEIFYISKNQKIFYCLLTSAFLFKLGSFPFHFYLADIYEALSAKETMLIYTITLKIFIFFTFIKFLSNYWYLNSAVSDILLYSGFGSIFVSSFAILKQYKLLRFWSFSYLNALGYTILSLSSGISSEYGELSFYSAKIYFISYLIVWFGIFDILYNKKMSHITYSIDLINNNFGNLNILKNYSFLFFLVSLLGLPPTLGFFSKAIVYFDLVSNSKTSLIFVATLLLTPFIAFAYLKLIIYLIVGFKNKNKYLKKSLKKQNNKNENIINLPILNYKLSIFLLFLSPIGIYLFENLSTTINTNLIGFSNFFNYTIYTHIKLKF